MKFDDDITVRVPVVLLFPDENESNKRELSPTLKPVRDALEQLRRRDEESTRPLRVRI